MLSIASRALRDWLRENPDEPITAERLASEGFSRGVYLRARAQLLAIDFLCEEWVLEGRPRRVTRIVAGQAQGPSDEPPSYEPPSYGGTPSVVDLGVDVEVDLEDLDLGAGVVEVQTAPAREDVDRLCAHLSARLTERDIRHAVTEAWRREARLLLDRDGRSEAQVHRMIEWCQDDPFWRANIHSMVKLRAKYDAMRDRATAAAQRPPQREGQIARMARIADQMDDHASGILPADTPREITI